MKNYMLICLAIEKFNPIVTELFHLSRNSKHFSCFLTKLYYTESTNARLNSAHYFIMKLRIKWEHSSLNVASPNSSDFNFKDLMNPYKKFTKTPFFLVINNILASDKYFCFRKNLTEKIQKLILTIDKKIR